MSSELIKKLDAIIASGVPVRIRADGLKKLARIPPIGTEILEACIKVLEETNEGKRYSHLLSLLSIQRGIAEQCFPDAPSTVYDKIDSMLPEWLSKSPITNPNNEKI